MKKYDELVVQFSDQIENLKKLKEAYSSAAKEAREAWGEWNEAVRKEGVVEWGEEDSLLSKAQGAERKVGLAWEEYESELLGLAYDVEEEYRDVPYAKPRRQGIARFWERSGIEAPFAY